MTYTWKSSRGRRSLYVFHSDNFYYKKKEFILNMIIIAAVCDLAVPDPGGPDRVPEVPLERPVEEDEEDN